MKHIYRTDDEWKVIIQKYKESNLSVPKFCEASGIAKTPFYNKLKQFGDNSLKDPLNKSSFEKIALYNNKILVEVNGFMLKGEVTDIRSLLNIKA